MPKASSITFRTQSELAAFKPESKPYRARDERQPGLVVSVAVSGTKSFVVRWVGPDGRQSDTTLGKFPGLTLEAARKQAADIRNKAAHADPNAVKREKREVARKARLDTIERIAERWWEERRDGGQVRLTTLAKNRHYLDSYVIPALGKRKVAELTTVELMDWLKSVSERARRAGPGTDGATAHNECRALVRSILDYAVTILRVVAVNVAAPVKPKGTTPRGRTLSDAELTAIWKACLDGEQSGATAHARKDGRVSCRAIRFQMLTLKRAGEVCAMRWQDVDLGRAVWRLSETDTKQRRAELVPLSDAVLTILRLQREDFPESIHVFPGREGQFLDRHSMGTAFSRLAKRCGIGGVRAHDLRRTGRTRLTSEALGISIETAERVLGHAVGGAVVRTYDVNAYLEPKRRALDAWASELMRIVEDGPTRSNIVPLARQAKAG